MRGAVEQVVAPGSSRLDEWPWPHLPVTCQCDGLRRDGRPFHWHHACWLAHVLPPRSLAIPLTYRNSGQAVSMAWHSGESLLVRNLNGNLWQYIS